MPMAKPFDVTLKDMLVGHPDHCLHYLGLQPKSSLDVVDADLATISTEADKVIRVNDAAPWLVHVEFQASADRQLSQRLLRYNVLLISRHRMPVLSVAVLLRAEADGPGMTGLLQHSLPGQSSYLDFRYKVVRAWRKPVEEVLSAGVGMLPLAPLADVAANDLPGVISRMQDRLAREPGQEQASLWTSTYILLGLRYSREFASQLLRGVRAMKESTTYQAILEEGAAKGRAEGRVEGRVQGWAEGEAKGRADEARQLLLRVGRKRWGTDPDAKTLSTLQAIQELPQLEQLTERILDVSGWQELLKPAPRSHRNGGRKQKPRKK